MQVQSEQLSPARKAWITRRAKALVRPVVFPPPAAPIPSAPTTWMTPSVAPPPPELQPVTELQVVELWLDDAVVGCGQRRFIVLDQSTREVRLFYAPLLATTTVPRRIFDAHHMPARKVRRKVIAEIIRARRTVADRVNAEATKVVMPDGGAFAVRALELLEGTS